MSGLEEDKRFFKDALARAENGEARQMITVALCYANGMGTDKDDALSMQWLGKVESANDLEALVDLGELYEQGRVIEKSLVKAKNIFLKIREENILVGSYMLGKYYMNLDKSSNSLRSAAFSFKDAADLGHVLSKIHYNKLERQGVLGIWSAIAAYLRLPVLIAYSVISIFSKDRNLRYWYYEDMFPSGKIAQELKKRMV